MYEVFSYYYIREFFVSQHKNEKYSYYVIMKEIQKQTIGKQISELRKENKLSQSEFGARLGVSQDTVSLWEKGKSLPATEYVIAMAIEFQCSTDEILCIKSY